MKYGSVYTPNGLATFVAKLLIDELGPSLGRDINEVFDPACGGMSLLVAVDTQCESSLTLLGIDFDDDAIESSSTLLMETGMKARLIKDDFIAPENGKDSLLYWQKTIGKQGAIVANPPWSSEHIYDRGDLQRRGFVILDGQYDSYSLFVELCIKLLDDGGVAAFILPDSLYSETATRLRQFIAENTEIRVLARLGEKLFPDVHRATTILVVRKALPTDDSRVVCFRLDTEQRRRVLSSECDLYDVYLANSHMVPQARFLEEENYTFDIDSRSEERPIIDTIREAGLTWSQSLKFYRGVEISKTGSVATCPVCDCAMATTRADVIGKTKVCRHCGNTFTLDAESSTVLIEREPKEGYSEVLAGEDIGRYQIRGTRYIKTGVSGINYKDMGIYSEPKLLVRKTGMGIKSVVDEEERLVTQTIYFFAQRNGEKNPNLLYYYAALLNSRIVYFYYIKTYGENEWKSHPYLTKRILESLPLVPYDPTNEACIAIGRLAKELCNRYVISVDLELEDMIKRLYHLSDDAMSHIKNELAKMPALDAIKEMKY